MDNTSILRFLIGPAVQEMDGGKPRVSDHMNPSPRVNTRKGTNNSSQTPGKHRGFHGLIFSGFGLVMYLGVNQKNKLSYGKEKRRERMMA